MKAIIWEVPAQQEADDALAASQDAVEFQQAMNEALQDIANGTITPAKVPQTRARQCILTTYPYSIIYTETDDEIRVFAFPHHKRKPGYWKRRLPKT